VVSLSAQQVNNQVICMDLKLIKIKAALLLVYCMGQYRIVPLAPMFQKQLNKLKILNLLEQKGAGNSFHSICLSKDAKQQMKSHPAFRYSISLQTLVY